MGKIATIRTKFDLSQTWDQRFNYPFFLKKHKRKWKKILKGVTKDELDGALRANHIDASIEIKITKSRSGCWEIFADICSDVLRDLVVHTIINLAPELSRLFAKKLKEKACKLLNLPLSSEENIIEVICFEITPADDNNTNAN